MSIESTVRADCNAKEPYLEKKNKLFRHCIDHPVTNCNIVMKVNPFYAACYCNIH
jgi:hypothetical protein